MLAHPAGAGVSTCRRARAFTAAADGQQRRVQAHLLGEEFMGAAAHPAAAEIHPRRLAPAVAVPLSAVDGLLEQRDARLPPERVAEERRRIGRQGQRQGRGQLQRVVGIRVDPRRDPVVHLERGVRPFQGNVRHVDLQRIAAVDIDAEAASPALDKLRDQGVVAAPVSDGGGTEIRLAQRGQDADGRHLAAVLRRVDPEVAEAVENLALRGREGAAGHRARRQVVLEVVAVELQREPRVRGRGVHFLVHMQRPAVGIDQVELELRAEGRRPGAEVRIGEQGLEVREVFLQLRLEGPEVLRAKGGTVDFDTHGGNVLCDRQ